MKFKMLAMAQFIIILITLLLNPCCDIVTYKKTWSCINSIIKGKSIKNFSSQIFANGNHINKNKDICECFNSYFANIGANLSRNTNNSKDPISYINSLNNPSHYFTPTNQFEILKSLKNIKNEIKNN